MVTYFKEGLRYIWPFKSKLNSSSVDEQKILSNPEVSQPIILFLGPWESSMVTLQSILIWEKPLKSACALFAANFMYWSFVLNNIKFFYGVSVLGLIGFTYHQWVYYIWPEISISSNKDQEDWTPIHPKVLSAPEVGRYIEDSYHFLVEQKSRLIQLRKKQPGLFCICMTFWFVVLGMLGRSVSGVNFLYGLLMLLMCGPAVLVHIVPKSLYIQLNNAWSILSGKSLKSDSSPSADISQFLPEETSEDAQSALAIPMTADTSVTMEDLVKLSKKKSKSRRSTYSQKPRNRNVSGISFTSGLSDRDFPSLGDTSDIEESDLALPEIIHENPSQDDINFVPTHFGDSSDDDKEFAEGLTFRDSIDGRRMLVSPTIPTPTNADPVIVSNPGLINQLLEAMDTDNAAMLVSSFGQQLVSAMSKTVPAKEPPQSEEMMNSWSDDFELISDDEI